MNPFEKDYYQVEEIGKLLVQAQDELREIRQSLDVSNSKPSTEISEMLYRVEDGFRAKAEIVLNGILNGNIKMLPSIQRDLPLAMQDKRNTLHHTSHPNNVAKLLSYMRSGTFIPNEPPHQESKPRNRRPVGRQPSHGRLYKEKVAKSRKILPKVNRNDATVAKPARPEIDENEASRGILELVQRGFIPTGLDVTPALTHGGTAFKNSTAIMHRRTELQMKPITHTHDLGFNVAAIKLDMETCLSQPAPSSHNSITTDPSIVALKSPRKVSSKSIEFLGDSGALTAVTSLSPTLQPKATKLSYDSRVEDHFGKCLRDNIEKIRGYNKLMDTYSLHQFIIRKGKTLKETPEFSSFRRSNLEKWEFILTIIEKLEQMLTKYDIPLAYVDGQQVVRLASTELTVSSTTPETLLACIINVDEVSSLLKRAGQRFQANQRKDSGALCLQSFFRMILSRKKYLRFRRETAAAKHLQQRWKVFSLCKSLKLEIRKYREKQAQQWNMIQQAFQKKWKCIKNKKRVVVHIPSISSDEKTRKSMENFQIQQNMQLARLCTLADPNVDIVYVSPYPLPEDIKEYYLKLLTLGGVNKPTSRLRIVTPENSNRFPDSLSLAALVLYSPQCLGRLRRYIRGKDAYIVPYVMGMDDQRLAMALHLPIMGPSSSSLSCVCSTRSGSKSIFKNSQVNTPLGAIDLYDYEELVVGLSKLIAANLTVPRWLIKLDSDMEGRGCGYLDVNRLQCVAELRRQQTKNALKDEFSSPTEEEIIEKIQLELTYSLPKLVQMCCKEVAPDHVIGYPAVNLFIEPTGEIQITSSLERMMSNTKKYLAVGASFPQKSVPFEALKGASHAIGKELYKKGLFGYVTINYVVFHDDLCNALRLWALNLSPYLTNTAISFVLYHYLLGGKYNDHSGTYTLSPPNSSVARTQATQMQSSRVSEEVFSTNPIVESSYSTDISPSRNESFIPSSLPIHSTLTTRDSRVSLSQDVGSPQRYYCVMEYMYNQNLATLKYAQFFNQCRLNGVCFDLKEYVGTIFLLADSLCSGVLSILSIGHSSTEALRYLHVALEHINQQVGSVPSSGQVEEKTGNFREILATVRARNPYQKKKSILSQK